MDEDAVGRLRFLFVTIKPDAKTRRLLIHSGMLGFADMA